MHVYAKLCMLGTSSFAKNFAITAKSHDARIYEPT